MRILILLAIGLLLFLIFRNLLRKNRNSANPPASEKMVRCEQCGLHLLEQEALQRGAKYYCSNEHLEAHQQDK